MQIFNLVSSYGILIKYFDVHLYEPVVLDQLVA